MKHPLWLLLVLAASVGACQSVTPIPFRTGDLCFRCQRPLADMRYAAQYVDAAWHAYKFRTADCMAQYLRDHDVDIQVVFVTDYTQQKMIPAERATFVPSIIDVNTREMAHAAFGRAAEAEAFGAEKAASPVDWAAVLKGTEGVGP